jgi:TRAP-type transport system small permease protein
MKNILKAIDSGMGYMLKGVSIFCLVALIFLMAANVLLRFVPIMSFHWFEEIVEWSFAWLVFFGSAALWRENEHFKIEWLSARLEGKSSGYILKLFIGLLSVFFFGVMAFQGLNHTMRADQWTNVLKIPKRLLYVCIPISGTIMFIYSIRNVVVDVIGFVNKLKSV